MPVDKDILTEDWDIVVFVIGEKFDANVLVFKAAAELRRYALFFGKLFTNVLMKSKFVLELGN